MALLCNLAGLFLASHGEGGMVYLAPAITDVQEGACHQLYSHNGTPTHENTKVWEGLEILGFADCILQQSKEDRACSEC